MIKKLDQKGFTAIEGILIAVVVLLLAGVGYYVYTQQNDETGESTTVSESTDSEETETEDIDSTIHEVDIALQTEADIKKLPDYTPDSFVDYMTDILKDNKYSYNAADGVDTITEYQISMISQVNIKGGTAQMDKDGEGHAGGAPAIWVLAPNGKWDKESLNGPLCESKNGGLVYEEFVEKCYTDADTESLVKNPNGSIESLNN